MLSRTLPEVEPFLCCRTLTIIRFLPNKHFDLCQNKIIFKMHMLTHDINLNGYWNHIQSHPERSCVEYPNTRLQEVALRLCPKKFSSAKLGCLFKMQNENATFHIAQIKNPCCHYRQNSNL